MRLKNMMSILSSTDHKSNRTKVRADLKLHILRYDSCL